MSVHSCTRSLSNKSHLWHLLPRFYLIFAVSSLLILTPGLEAQQWSQLSNPNLYCVSPSENRIDPSYLVRVRSESDHRFVLIDRWVRNNRRRLRNLRARIQRLRPSERRRQLRGRRQHQLGLRQEVLECRNSGGACNAIAHRDESSLSARVINGTKCNEIGNSPVVELKVRFSQGYFGCTGSVITPYRVLTAAHCVANDEEVAQEVHIFTGAPGGGDGQVTFEVAEYVIHPANLTGKIGDHDIAILKFEDALPTRVVRIVESTEQFQSQETMVVTGYGYVGQGQSAGKFDGLNAGKMRLDTVTEEQVLAVFDHVANGPEWSHICSGDSGGPLLVYRDGDWIVAGVASYVYKTLCGPIDEAGFVNLTSPSNRSFIAEHAPGAFE